MELELGAAAGRGYSKKCSAADGLGKGYCDRDQKTRVRMVGLRILKHRVDRQVHDIYPFGCVISGNPPP